MFLEVTRYYTGFLSFLNKSISIAEFSITSLVNILYIPMVKVGRVFSITSMGNGNTRISPEQEILETSTRRPWT